MPNYDFHNCLSPREFEEFARDVLEIKEKVPLEISGRGKDGGVDLRYWEGTIKIIVQVKCFQKNFSQLYSVLKNQEKQKAKVLNPSRYILVTSFTLELTERDRVFDLFDGLIRKREDIIDRGDLNKLLENEQYHNVERTHYKLWLSSTNVLTTLIEAVVHRGILAESKFELEAIKKTIPVFVQNPSFECALDILERNRYILISGEPGIGKTILGRCLAAYYLQQLGYRDFIYADKIGSALKMYKEEEKQVFFFDDFWGDTFKDEKLPHNEEKRLLKFVQIISESHNKILILTSREYVLQQGLAEYHNEQLKTSLNIGKCFLKLEDYSDLTKAKILFNHLYFADKLEWDYVEVIAKGYERITNHQNYHPRIIENFLNQGSLLMEDNAPREFYNKFLDYLNDPSKFWEAIFLNLTYGARLTALLLLLSSQPIRLDDLKESFYSCIEAGRQNHLPIEEEAFENIIAQLEKTMIITHQMERTSTILVKFQNPSIKDFLYRYLSENLHPYGKMLIQGCPFINQLLFMFKTTESKRYIDEGIDEHALNKEKIILPKKLEILLRDRIIYELDTLKYSYVEGDPYIHKPSVHVAPEDCIVGKLNDVVFSLGVNENVEMYAFIIDKVKLFCMLLHKEDYPFSYDDMVELPYLIQSLMPLQIDFDANLLINDYYAHSRFAEHLLLLDNFQEIFPKEYADFKKSNYITIKRKIKWMLLDDVDFFDGNGQDERVDFLIDMVYPQILERYKLRDSKRFRHDLRMTAGYFDDSDDEKMDKQREKRKKSREEKIRSKEETRKKTEEMIKTEQDTLLGVREELSDDEIIDFINRNVQNATEASELVCLFQNQKPWYIWPFFSNWNRLSLLLAFYQEQKKLPLTSVAFYEQLTAYLLKEHDATAIGDAYSWVEMFSAFAFDMMEKGQIIFSNQNIEDHPVFKHKLETGQIDLLTTLSFPFLVQRGKWYEFLTLPFQAYLSLQKFISRDEKERIASYEDFLDLDGCFKDHEHDIWLLCSELDLQVFNQHYAIPILKEYLSAIDTTNRRTVCSSTVRFLELSMDFKIPSDTLLPEVSGACCSGVPVSILSFTDKDLLAFDLYMSCSGENERDGNKNYSDLLRLSRFILQKGSKASRKDEYELDLAKHSENPEFLEILVSLGVCDYLWDFYHDVWAMVEKAEAVNYNIRLDRYAYDSETRMFALER